MGDQADVVRKLFRRQLAVAAAMVLIFAVYYLITGVAFGLAVKACGEVGLVCLAPVLFAWSTTLYRGASLLLAAVITFDAISWAENGSYGLLVAVVVVWAASFRLPSLHAVDSVGPGSRSPEY